MCPVYATSKKIHGGPRNFVLLCTKKRNNTHERQGNNKTYAKTPHSNLTRKRRQKGMEWHETNVYTTDSGCFAFTSWDRVGVHVSLLNMARFPYLGSALVSPKHLEKGRDFSINEPLQVFRVLCTPCSRHKRRRARARAYDVGWGD